jgi:short-subunit dehydrogenase
MAVDQKVWNLFRFVIIRLSVIAALFYVLIRVTGMSSFFEVVGVTVVLVLLYRFMLMLWRRSILPPKRPLAYGKWAIVTGSTAGIGKEFAEHLASEGMFLLLISRNIDKLREQRDSMVDEFNVDVDIMEHDFTSEGCGAVSRAFYRRLDEKCAELDQKGGIGLLVNNVGIMNEVPMNLDEFSDDEVQDMLQCNVCSTVSTTRTVFKYMKGRRNGAVVSISAGAANHPTPMQAVYSATK